MVAMIALLAPGAEAAATPVGLQTDPAIQEYSPAATATYEAWEQDSVASPNTWNVYAQPRAGGASWKVNARNTQGYVPSPVTGGNESIIYTQQTSRTSGLFIYNLAAKVRTALPAKVDSAAWNYSGVASTKYIAFMRLTSTTRELLLYNRSSGRTTQVATTKRSCSSCLQPTWVGATHLAYDTCSATNSACNSHVLTIGGAAVTVPRAPAPHSVYGAAVDEATGNVYFVSSTTWCGLFVSVERWNLAGGAPSDLYDLPEGFDIFSGISLAPDTSTPGNLDALYSQYDCIAENYDNYALESANTLLKLATRAPAAAPAAGPARRTRSPVPPS
jgi:hypothetical protein